MAIESINPATEEILATFDELSPGQVDEVIDAAHKAWGSWSRTPITERQRLMRGVAGYLRENKPRFSRLITVEMGKPIVEAEAEIEKCALTCNFYAENAERFLSTETVKTNAAESYVAFEPLGVVLGIMPWNFPLAGLPLHRSRSHGGQHSPPQARLQCAAVLARNRRSLYAGRPA
jgi:acyl-CoA reductase-like NAD-dependent aldehyde dehydrogenase